MRLSHFKFRTHLSSDTQATTIDLHSPVSPFLTTTATYQIPTIELDQKQTLGRLTILFRLYAIPLDTSKIRTSGDEMELYANIIRHYRSLFVRQEKERPIHYYEPSAINFANEKRKSPENLLIKKSTWVPYFSLKPELNAQRERDFWRYVKSGKNDELLLRITHFLQVRQSDKAANVLKQYLLALRTKRSTTLKQILETSANNPMQATAMADMFWKNIFDLNSGDGDDGEDDNEVEEIEGAEGNPSIRFLQRRTARPF